MPVHFEAKVRIDAPEAVVARLRERGATMIGDYRETDTYFDTDDRQLLASDEGLRLRVQEDLNLGKIECVLAHKGPARNGQLRSRDESRLIVENPADAAMLLSRIGYGRCLSFEKRRQSWKLEGCGIDIEEIPHLGQFVEIKGPSEEAVMRMREALALTDRPLVKGSFVAMLTSYMQERGQPTRDVAFPRESTPRIARAG